MSIEKVARQGGDGWRVRWRQSDANRSRVFDRKSDARLFEGDVRRKKQTAELGLLDGGRQTLDAFAAEVWKLHVRPNVARRTDRLYLQQWDSHISPRLGSVPLRELSPEMCNRVAAELAAKGVGAGARRKALGLLQMVLERAVEWGHLPRNPAAHVRKPPARRVRTVRPLAPAQVEAIRAGLGQRDATLVAVLAYAGLRPSEALALTWGHVRERTLLVEGAVADGEVKSTKTGQTRSVRLVAPLAADLREWRMASGRPADGALVFGAKGGGLWADHDWRNWRRRVFEPAATAAKLDPAPRPYDLRHSYISMLIREGVSIVEVAEQAGHSPAMCLATYAHVMRDLEGGERRTVEEEISRARVPVSYPAAARGQRG